MDRNRLIGAAVTAASVFLVTDISLVSGLDQKLESKPNYQKLFPSCPEHQLSPPAMQGADMKQNIIILPNENEDEGTCYDECLGNGGGEKDCCHCGKAISWYCQYLATCWGPEAAEFCDEIYHPHCCMTLEGPEYMEGQGPKDTRICLYDVDVDKINLLLQEQPENVLKKYVTVTENGLFLDEGKGKDNGTVLDGVRYVYQSQKRSSSHVDQL